MAMLDGPDVLAADPRVLLLGYLDWYREALLRKLAGLPDDLLRAPVEGVGWSPLGLVRHLTGVERRWLRWGFLAEDVVSWEGGGPDEEWRVPADVPSAALLAAYDAQVALSRAAVGDHALDTPPRLGGRFTDPAAAPPLGRILFHLLQEYARHLGHLDIARQLLDGTTGE